MLRLDHNRLTELPSWISHFDDLDYLSASYNLLESIPQKFPKRLSCLDLAHNRLRSLSPNLAKSVPFLKELRLH